MTQPSGQRLRYCQRCSHLWQSRRAQRPLRCARCKSPYWRIPPERPSAGKHAPQPQPPDKPLVPSAALTASEE